jgi:hypothetical protein
MARNTSNRRIQQQDNGTHFDENSNAQAVESALARFEQVGVYRKANVAAPSAAVPLTLGGVDADTAGQNFLAGRKGVIVGIAWDWSTVPTAGTASLQAQVAGTASGDAISILAVKGVGDETTEIPFNEGDLLGLAITTNGAFLPITGDVAAWLLIRWIAA